MTIAEVNKTISDEGGRAWELRMWARRLDNDSVERMEKEWDDPEQKQYEEALMMLAASHDDVNGVGAYTKGCESIIINHWLNQYSRDEMIELLNGLAKVPDLAGRMSVTISPYIDPLSLETIAYRWNYLHEDEEEIMVNYPPAVMI